MAGDIRVTSVNSMPFPFYKSKLTLGHTFLFFIFKYAAVPISRSIRSIQGTDADV